jgi:hypothetical protein
MAAVMTAATGCVAVMAGAYMLLVQVPAGFWIVVLGIICSVIGGLLGSKWR